MESIIPSGSFTEPGQALRLGPPTLLLQPQDPSPLPRDLQAGRPSRRPRPRASLSQRSSRTSTAALELLEHPSRRGAHLTPSSSRLASPYLPSLGQSSSPCDLVLCSSDFSIVPSPHLPDPPSWARGLSPLAEGSVELRPGRWPASL